MIGILLNQYRIATPPPSKSDSMRAVQLHSQSSFLALQIFLTCCWLLISSGLLHAQWQAQHSHTESNFRGLCVVGHKVAWASGSKGTFIRTIDGGETWQARKVPGAEELDFRDVEALDGDTAWLLSIGNGPESRIYKTTDGGSRWTLQFQNNKSEAFFTQRSGRWPFSLHRHHQRRSVVATNPCFDPCGSA
jgi:photosystem II stability/assembly factor-like uncharacterized protein